MKLPDNVNAQLAACINAVHADIVQTDDPQTALVPLAMEIMHREFGAFVLFCRFGDRDALPPGKGPRDVPRAFGIMSDGAFVQGKDLDPRLAKVIRDWLAENGG